MKKGLPIDLIEKGIWHIHTDYTDGKNTVEDYAEKASELNIPLLCFTEHVRTQLDYDFHNYIQDINAVRRKYPHILSIAGIEVRALEGGSLDVSLETLRCAEYVIVSIHKFPKNKEIYLETLGLMFLSPYMDTWGHPFRFAVNNDIKIEKTEALKIFQKAAMNKIMIETPRMWDSHSSYYHIKKINTADIHSVKEMEEFYEKRKSDFT